MSERKYAMTRVAPGDYLLPSNDGRTLWRLSTYEDGPSYGLDVKWSDRKFWGVWRFDGDFSDGVITGADVEDWNRWELVHGMLGTRREAMESALAGGFS